MRSVLAGLVVLALLAPVHAGAPPATGLAAHEAFARAAVAELLALREDRSIPAALQAIEAIAGFSTSPPPRAPPLADVLVDLLARHGADETEIAAARATASSLDPEAAQALADLLLVVLSAEPLVTSPAFLADPRAYELAQHARLRQAALAAHAVAERREILLASDAGPIDVCGVLLFDLAGARSTIECDHIVSVSGAGDTLYLNNAGGADGPTRPVSIAIDLAGNDRYLGVDADSGGINGGANLGFGLLVDLEGDDHYNGFVRLAGGVNGGSRTGAGGLLDLAGNDVYNGRVAFGGVTGAVATGGASLFLDLGGVDTFDALVAVHGGANGGANDGLAVFLRCGERVDYRGADRGRGGVNGGQEQALAYFMECGADGSTFDGFVEGGGVNGGGSDEGFSLFVWAAGDATFHGRAGTHGGVNGGTARAEGLFISGYGDQVYDGWTGSAGGVNGGAVLGQAAFIDLSGNDVYRGLGNATAGINGGSAVAGSALLLDLEGDDSYEGWATGEPQFILFDQGGAAINGEGDKACGALVDKGGNDRYRRGLTGPWSYDVSRVPAGTCGVQIDM